MAQPFTEDLKLRVVRAVESGPSQASVAKLFCLGRSTVERYISRWRENGRFERGKFGGHRKPIVAEHQALVARLVKADPDMTLGVFQAKLAAAGIQVCAAALHNLLKRLGYSYQKTAGRRRTKAQRRSGATPGMAKVSSRT